MRYTNTGLTCTVWQKPNQKLLICPIEAEMVRQTPNFFYIFSLKGAQ